MSSSSSSSSSSLWMAFVVLVNLTLATTIECNTKSDCGIAQTAFGMCVPYMMGREHVVSRICCEGVKAVRELSPSPRSRRLICDCLRNLMVQVGRIDRQRASGLAGKCRVRTNVIPTSLRFRCFEIA